MSKLVSMRLESGLADWVESYRESRGWSRAELIDAALRSYREDTVRGVPELPSRPSVVAKSAEREELERAQREAREAIRLRQAALNSAKVRAS